MSDRRSTTTNRRWRIIEVLLCYGLPLCAIVILGSVNLPRPLHGDQAMFLLGAQTLDRGGALYVDYWDMKQPGVFLFYLLAGRIFGFSEFGVHSLELIWHCAFAVVLVALLRRYFERHWLSSLVPLTTIGVYYCHTGVWHLTQLEILVGLPLFLVVWFSTTIDSARPRRPLHYALAGICAAVVLVFKLILAPLVAAFWLLGAAVEWRAGRVGVTQAIFGRVLPAVIGLAATLAVILGVCALAGLIGLRELVWTSLVYPLETLHGVAGAGPGRLAGALLWFGHAFLPWLPLVVLAVLVAEPAAGRRHLTWQFMAWVVVGLAVIVIQRLSWWEYHFLLLFVPVGVLAVRGVDLALSRFAPLVTARRRSTALLCLLLVAPAVAYELVPWGANLRRAATVMIAGGSFGEPYQRSEPGYPDYDQLWQETRFLFEPDARPGPIYVFGNPLAVLLSGRRQAIPIHGWMWEIMPEPMWQALPGQLAAAHPAYIFIDSFYQRVVAERSPEMMEFLASQYRLAHSSAVGVWYQARDPGAPAPG